MDDKRICGRCGGEIHSSQGVAYFGHYIAHRLPEYCTEYLKRKIQDSEQWRIAAQRLGEMYGGSKSPDGYYDMTPEQWLEWMDDMLTEREWDAM